MRTFLWAAAFAVATASAAQAADPVVMRISHQLPPAHHIAQLVDQWAADVEQRTEGQVDVQILGANQAFSPDQNHPAVARGEIEGALSVNFQWGGTIPETSVTLIPYFFGDLGKIERFPGSEPARLLEEKLLEKGVRNIGWFYTTRQSIFTSSKKPLIELEDFQGVKIRGLNKLVDNALTAVGAAPAAMPGSEVYQSLQTGVIDAGLTDLSAAYSRRFYEVQEFGTVTPFFTVYFHMYVNPQWWDGLDPEVRSAIEAATRDAEMAAIPLTEQTAEEALGLLREKGMKVHVQTPEEQKAWEDAMQPPVRDAFIEAAPEDGPRLIEMLRNL